MLLIFVPVFIFQTCNRHEKHNFAGHEFDFCKEIDEDECIPPLLSGKGSYTFSQARHTKTNRDYFNDIYFTGDALAFQIKLQKKLTHEELENWKNNLVGWFRFPEINQKFHMERIDFHRESILGLSLVGSILEKRFADTLPQPWRKVQPVTVIYEFYLGDKKIGQHSIILEIL